jgi:hypothetical protein
MMQPFDDFNKIIKVVVTSEEAAIVKNLAGGEREVGNYLRQLIREDATKKGVELPEHVFLRRKGGNWLPKKENRQRKVNLLPVIA